MGTSDGRRWSKTSRRAKERHQAQKRGERATEGQKEREREEREKGAVAIAPTVMTSAKPTRRSVRESLKQCSTSVSTVLIQEQALH